MVWAVITLRPYFKCAKFKARSDHNELKWMMKLKHSQGRLIRWSLRLMEFDYEIVYRPGRFHQVTDEISRLPHPTMKK